MAKKVALITGITGQDGSYLTEFLLDKGYLVHGLVRRASTFNTGRIEHLRAHKNLSLHYSDLLDSSSICSIVAKVRPDEVYNLAAQSHVGVSFEMPIYSADVDGLGTLRLLSAIQTAGIAQTCKFYQASTSELFGKVQETPQRETTPFYPRSPYAVAKQFAYWIVVNYREAHNMFATNGILFNHESPRRGPTFVTRKITRAVARIKRGLQDCLYLGNIDSKRDWGHAKEYVQAMWLMLQQEKPDDFVVATGKTSTVRYFVEISFAQVGINIKWEGAGTDEVGIDEATGKIHVKIATRYYRPTEVDLLLGDGSKIKEKLGWSPGVSLGELCKEMVLSDLALVDSGDLRS